MIDHILIKNFKSIKKAETKFPSYLGAIVGKNAAGKTNLIQAINFVKNLAIGENTMSALKKIALTPQEIYNYNESSADITVSITISSESDGKYILELIISTVKDESNIQNLVIKNESLTKIDNSEKSEVIYKRNGSALQDKDGKDIPLAVEADKAAVSQYQNPDVLNVKNIFSNIFIPEQDSIDFRESIVKKDGRGLASLVVRLRQADTSSFEQFQKIIKKLLPQFSSLVEIPSSQTSTQTGSGNLFMVLLQEEDLKGQLSMKSVSAGDLRTLYLIASAMFLKPGSTFIFEEIENGLHTKRLRDMLDHLNTISRKKGMQIIFSTHSSLVINSLSPQDVVYVGKDSANGTKFYLLSDSSDIRQIEHTLMEGVSLTDYLSSRLQ